jgi:hypothetical protein
MPKRYQHIGTKAVVEAVTFDEMMSDYTGTDGYFSFEGKTIEVVSPTLCMVEAKTGFTPFPRGEMLILGDELHVCQHDAFASTYVEATRSRKDSGEFKGDDIKTSIANEAYTTKKKASHKKKKEKKAGAK